MRHRHALVLLAITTPICVVLRVIQMCFIIDEKTGFAKQTYSAINFGIMIIICASALAVALLATNVEETKQVKKELRPSLAIVSALVSGMFLYQMVSGVSGRPTAWYDVILVVMALASAVVFLAYGLKNIYVYNMPPIIMIVPVLYYIVRLISVFVSTSELSLVTENIFLIFTSSILLWFMYELASFENGIGATEKAPKKLFASGLAAVILCAVTSVSKLVFAVVSDTDLSSGDISSALLNMAMGCFVLVYIVCNFIQKPEKKVHQSKHSI